MADIRTPAPALGTLGTTPAIHTNILPRWAYLALALACVCMGVWASYITLEYFEHGAKALETDKALQALAVSAALMFVASEMSAFALAALLTERQLKARRWSLTGFAAAVLALEVCTIVAVQLALTSGADLAQSTVQTQEADLRKRIALIEADAAAKRATADQQRAKAKNAYELHLAGKSGDKAAAEQSKTTTLYDELAKVQAQKRPTMIGLMGEKYALAYAIARGVLVSMGGLVFFGVAGALLRAARGGAQSVDAQLLALLHELRGTPVHMAMQAQTVAPTGQAPAPVSFKPVGTVAPAGAPVGVSYGGRVMLAGAGALAAAAPVAAHAAPHAPVASAAGGVSKSVHPDVSKPIHAQDVQEGSADASKAAPAVLETSATGVSESVHAGVSESVQQIVKKPRAKRAVNPRVDTGVEGKAGARFKRIKAGVLAGKIRPSVRGIQAVEGGSQEVVADYIKQLETEGVIVKSGRGYALAGKAGAA